MATIRGVLFDKDGTLFDFQATWSTWAARLLEDLADGDPARAAALGARIGFDPETRTFVPDSPVIADTPDRLAALLSPLVPGMGVEALTDFLNASAARAPQVPIVPLAPVLTCLREMGLKLGLATNDAEAPARAHLRAAGQQEAFDFVAGYDSGHGGKPEPGMCLAFARAAGLDPAQVIMVGDSAHDMHAGRAAGMRCVAVLSGLAATESLAPHADAVLAHIGHLADWILSQNK